MNGGAQSARQSSQTFPFDSSTSGPTGDSHRRLIGLDVLRFFAATLVLHIHAVHQFGKSTANPPAGWLGWIINTLAAVGPNGVDIFFVLSGFLVAGLFFEELKRSGTVSPGYFLIRRGFKIYPQFWAMTCVTICFYLAQSKAINPSALASDLLFFQCYVPGMWPHTWTLSVEEHFYVFLAICFFILKHLRRGGQRVNVDFIPAICLAIMILCLAARLATWRWSWDVGVATSLFTRVTHVRMDSLFFGVLLAFFWHWRWSQTVKDRLFSNRFVFLTLGTFLVLTPYPMRLVENEPWLIFGCMLLYLGSGCLLLAALSLDHSQCPRFFHRLAWLGRYSYAVYLWHLLLLWLLVPIMGIDCASPITFLVKELLFFLGIWSLSIALTKLIEFPVLHYRDKLFPSRS